MAIDRNEMKVCGEEPQVSDTVPARENQNIGRTYCVMAPVASDRAERKEIGIRVTDDVTGKQLPAVRRTQRRRKTNPLIRAAAGLLLTAAAVTMPLWLTTDGMLPVMKRLSTAAMPVGTTAQNVELSATDSTADNTVQSTTATAATASAPTTVMTAAPAADPPDGMLPVSEKQIGNSGTKVRDIYVKNSTGYEPDFETLLDSRADCRIRLNAGYQVLIVHTHTTECYARRTDGVYDPDYSPRTTDSAQSVVAVGEVLAKQLEAAGIRTLHAVEVHDHPQYNGSYDRALDTIEKYLREHPSIEMVLDVHRDAITYDDGSKLKPTAEINGRKAAQVMIISGCDADGRLYFPDWKSNLTMALQIQQAAGKKYSGLMRPLNFAPYRYNMHMTPNSLLLEFGTDVNTLEEALYSAELMGGVLADVLLKYDVAR